MKYFRDQTHIDTWLAKSRVRMGNQIGRSCGAHSHMLTHPIGANVVCSAEEIPTIEKTPIPDGRYALSQRSVKLAEGQYISYRLIHTHDRTKSDVSHPELPAPRVIPADLPNVFSIYWASFDQYFRTGFPSPVTAAFNEKPIPGKHDADVVEDMVEALKGITSVWVLRDYTSEKLSGAQANIYGDQLTMFKEKFVIPSGLEIVHESEKFNNRNYDRPVDDLTLIVLREKA